MMMLKILLTLSFVSVFAGGKAPAELPANELGQIMVLEYHHFGAEGRWSRSIPNFRKDLEALYARGYYLTNLNDLLDHKITVPAGKTPVVLTFDDSAGGQFGLVHTKDGDILDPNTAAGAIKKFSDDHPDFGRAGTFYLNPNGKRDKAWSKVLNEMVAQGFELGNHTVTHPQLRKLSYEKVENEIAMCQAWIDQNVPGYQVRSMALPFGIYPMQNGHRMDSWASDGESQGVRYHHEALLEVGSGPAPSPFSPKFDAMHIPRIQVWGNADPGQPVFDYFLHYYDKHPEQRFVSDGNPETLTIKKGHRGDLHSKMTEDFQVIEN
ncbi:MAG: polysaccharide deacetylase family protein [Deltaproteobacteria bacterium]|nr:polysaccharide deacetylase family protein [Deltaproteobacteria bacterium]